MIAKSGVNCMRMLPLVSNRGCDLTINITIASIMHKVLHDPIRGFSFLHEKNDFAKGSKILLNTDLIILLEP